MANETNEQNANVEIFSDEQISQIQGGSLLSDLGAVAGAILRPSSAVDAAAANAGVNMTAGNVVEAADTGLEIGAFVGGPFGAAAGAVIGAAAGYIGSK